MRRLSRWTSLFPGTLLAGSLGCDGLTVDPDPGIVTVQIAYFAATTTDPSVAAAFPDCVSGVGATHLHPGWRPHSRVDLTAVGAQRWEGVFDDVPVGVDLHFRINDPNACARDPFGASTENVFANGVWLTRIVDTRPGRLFEAGLAFQVDAAGAVTP